MCGEKLRRWYALFHPLGSPPRVRGKGHRDSQSDYQRGITPACAGKSSHPYYITLPRGDHPRVCGEKGLSMFWSLNHSGSPPHVRGKVVDYRAEYTAVGITPAYAGKRLSLFGKTYPEQDHPRVCGEKFHPASDRKLGRVRGTKRSSGPAPAAAPAGLAGSCPASPPWSYPPRITVSRPRP